MIVINEVDGAEAAVLFNLPYHTAYAIAVVWVVLHRQADAIVACGYQLLTCRFLLITSIHIPAYTLMHHGFQVVGSRQVLSLFRPAFRNRILWEQLYGICPRVAILRSLEHRLARSLVLMTGICQEVQPELSIAISYHWLMIVGPRLFTSHGLDAVYTHNGFQPSVMSLRAGDSRAAVMNHVTVVFDEPLHKFFVGREHRAVLMAHREADSSCLILEGSEVFRAMGTVYLVLITVVVDVIPVSYFRRRGTLGK